MNTASTLNTSKVCVIQPIDHIIHHYSIHLPPMDLMLGTIRFLPAIAQHPITVMGMGILISHMHHFPHMPLAQVIAHPHCRVLVDMLLPHHIINCLHTPVGVGRRCLPTAIHPRMGIYMLHMRLRLWLDRNHPPLKVNLCTNFTCHCHCTVHPLPRLHTPQHLLWKLSSIS